MDRVEIIENWLKTQLNQYFTIEPVSSDASFRRYFRIIVNNKTFILMDAPPDLERIDHFLNITKNLASAEINAPKIISYDTKLGLILMTDFGNQTYLDVLSGNKLGMFQQELYSAAIDSLLNIQTKVIPWGLQDYSDELLISEMSLFPKWYLEKFKKFKLQDQEVLNEIFSEIVMSCKPSNMPGPPMGLVFVHRDYHSRNLMFIREGNNPGILDYQDAVVGPCTYDLVSLLKDAYIELDEEFIVEQVARYWEKVENFDPDYLEWQAPKLDPLEQFERGAPAYFKHFYKDFEMMGVQRHLKILGIFSRLSIRDKKNQYLKNIPLVEKYLMNTTEKYEELHPLRRILDKVVS